jgi:hypothetical protein
MPSRYAEYVNKPLSNEARIGLAQALGVPFVKGKDGSVKLVQDQGTSPPIHVPMINQQNMGYEGSFFFGSPAQQLQVVFDTGSAWVWVFSESCGVKDNTCPMRQRRFMQS